MAAVVNKTELKTAYQAPRGGFEQLSFFHSSSFASVFLRPKDVNRLLRMDPDDMSKKETKQLKNMELHKMKKHEKNRLTTLGTMKSFVFTTDSFRRLSRQDSSRN